jgi:outer membrane protein OmpA-like peptidoglycan-associated protein
VIEEKPFQASLQAPQANALKTALDREGRVALYVNFDFAKATLKPDAAPVVAQIVKLLKDNPGLKLSVEGHTDNVGTHDANLKLSEQRAAAVMGALVSAGIPRDRLQSAGYGPDKPVADNDTGEGRAKNRRVELVKR